MPQVIRWQRRFASEVATTLVSANREFSHVTPHVGLPMVADRIAGRLRPHRRPRCAGDRHAATPWLLTLPVDLVGVNDCLLPTPDRRAPSTTAPIADDDDGPQPLVALWRVAALARGCRDSDRQRRQRRPCTAGRSSDMACVRFRRRTLRQPQHARRPRRGRYRHRPTCLMSDFPTGLLFDDALAHPPRSRRAASPRYRIAGAGALPRPRARARRRRADAAAAVRQQRDGRLRLAPRRPARGRIRAAPGRRAVRRCRAGVCSLAPGECVRITTGAPLPAGRRHGGDQGKLRVSKASTVIVPGNTPRGRERAPRRRGRARRRSRAACRADCSRRREALARGVAGLAHRCRLRASRRSRCSPPATNWSSPACRSRPGRSTTATASC